MNKIEITEGTGKYWHEAYAALQDSDKWEVFTSSGDRLLFKGGLVFYAEEYGGDSRVDDISEDHCACYFASPNFTIVRKGVLLTFEEALTAMYSKKYQMVYSESLKLYISLNDDLVAYCSQTMDYSQFKPMSAAAVIELAKSATKTWKVVKE